MKTETDVERWRHTSEEKSHTLIVNERGTHDLGSGLAGGEEKFGYIGTSEDSCHRSYIVEGIWWF